MTHPCWNCCALIAAPIDCPLCGAVYDEHAARALTLIAQIEQSAADHRALLAHLRNSARKHGMVMCESKAGVLLGLCSEDADEVRQLRDRLREDMERKTAVLKAVS